MYLEPGLRQVLQQIPKEQMEQKSSVQGQTNTNVCRQTCRVVRTELLFVTCPKLSKKKGWHWQTIPQTIQEIMVPLEQNSLMAVNKMVSWWIPCFEARCINLLDQYHYFKDSFIISNFYHRIRYCHQGWRLPCRMGRRMFWTKRIQNSMARSDLAQWTLERPRCTNHWVHWPFKVLQ